VSAELVVCGIAGSLRRDSWNHRLLRAVAALAPPGVEVRVSELLPRIPLFNEDLLDDVPDAVRLLRAEVAAADALMIATPEYNGGVPGVLKNALDWLSLPLGGSALQNKPVGLLGATPGVLGTARSQFELRHMFVYTGSPVMPGPEVLVRHAHTRLGGEDGLTDPDLVARIALLFKNLTTYARLNHHEAAATR
jgi:chromate reductase, NAD(P)H dehydrogenase (quinone)